MADLQNCYKFSSKLSFPPVTILYLVKLGLTILGLVRLPFPVLATDAVWRREELPIECSVSFVACWD